MAGAPTIDALGKGIQGITDNLVKSNVAVGGLGAAFEGVLSKVVPAAAGVLTLTGLLGSKAKPFSLIMDAAKSSVADIGSKYASIQKELEEVIKAADEEYLILGHTNGVLQAKELLLKEQARYLRQQYDLVQVLNQANEKAVRLAKVLAANFAAAWLNTQNINKELRNAVSTGVERARLELSVYENTVRTGLSLHESANAAAALAEYGLENRATFNDNVRTISLMTEGLGMSSREAAHLAAVTEGMIHANFKEVANTVASIVEYTALAADEASNYGRELAKTMSILRLDNADKTMPGVLKAIGSYEGALKELTGKSGDFMELVKKMQSSSGIAQLRVLGISPEMLKTEQGVKAMMDRFGDYATKFVGQTSGMNRAMRLEMLASQMGMTTEAANGMLLAIEKQRTQTLGNITLEERAKNQMDSMNKGLERLANRIMALIQGGLYPITWAIGGLTNVLDKVIGFITNFKGVMYVAMAGVVGASLWAVKSLAGVARSAWRLASALVPTAAGIDRLTASIARLQMSTVATGSLPGGGPALPPIPSAATSGISRSISASIRLATREAAIARAAGASSIVVAIRASAKFIGAVTSSAMSAFKGALVPVIGYLASVVTAFKTNYGAARLLGGSNIVMSLLKGIRTALFVALGPVSVLLAGILAVAAVTAVASAAMRRSAEKQLQKTQEEILARRAGTGSALRSMDAATQRSDAAAAKAIFDKRKRDIEFGRGEFANSTKLEKSSALAELTRRAKDQTTMALYASQRWQQLAPQFKSAVDAAYQGKGSFAGQSESSRFDALKSMYITAVEEKRREAAATGSVNAAQDADTLSTAVQQLEVQRNLALETEKNRQNAVGLRADQRAKWAEEEKMEMHRALLQTGGSWSTQSRF